MYGIPDKYIKVICAMIENNVSAVKVEIKVSSWFCIKSGDNLCVVRGCVQSPFIWIIFINFDLMSTARVWGETGNQTEN